jgi:hypothetical protein
MLTEPVGPRSPDEILASVYERTQHTRRRRRTQLGAGGALAVAVLLGLLAVRPSGEEARLRVIDRNPGTEEAAATRVPPASDDEQLVAAAETTTTTAARRRERPGRTPPAGAGPVTTPPPTITTTTTTTLPPVRLLAEATDAQNDATPNDWYYDVVYGSMHFDAARGGLLFTTSYRNPGSSPEPDRSDRTMSTRVTYDQSIYEITVDEVDGQLSNVKVDGRDCGTCQVAFGSAMLTVQVPVDEFNAAIAAKGATAAPLRADSQITDLEVATAPIVADLPSTEADTSRNSGGVQ